ncbi:MAG TPA: hypothetical protein VN605_12090, partial [Thermoanaerobaculia bacterium]|nr:hypothetical protein [Thermoanaerobaculia bacterium]
NRLRRRGEWVTRETAPWNLGSWSPLVNAIALAWIAVIAVVFLLPPNELVLWTMIAVAIVLAVYYALRRSAMSDEQRAMSAALHDDRS